MDVIPVIDIKNGQVVHAQGGRRDSYRPIQTPLSATSDPADARPACCGWRRSENSTSPILMRSRGARQTTPRSMRSRKLRPESNSGWTTASRALPSHADGWTDLPTVLSSAASCSTDRNDSIVARRQACAALAGFPWRCLSRACHAAPRSDDMARARDRHDIRAGRCRRRTRHGSHRRGCGPRTRTRSVWRRWKSGTARTSMLWPPSARPACSWRPRSTLVL